jgi:hypothetical protein
VIRSFFGLSVHVEQNASVTDEINPISAFESTCLNRLATSPKYCFDIGFN